MLKGHAESRGFILESVLGGCWYLPHFSAADTATGNWTQTQVSSSFLVSQTMHVLRKVNIYIQLSFSSKNNNAPINKVTVWIKILYNESLTWITISSFANDFVPSGQVTLFPKYLEFVLHLTQRISRTTKVESTHSWGQMNIISSF